MKAQHSIHNKQVKVAGKVYEVGSAWYRAGGVAYMIKRSGHVVYSWERSVEAVV